MSNIIPEIIIFAILELMEENTLPLTPEEWNKWTELTKRIRFENGRIPLEPFYAWSEYLYTIPVELIPFRIKNSKPEILLIHRKDKYYDGYHTPGAIITPGIKSTEKLAELIKRELGEKVKIEKLQFVRYYDIMKGNSSGENVRGQELKLVFSGLVSGDAKEGEWFTRDNIPKNTIPELEIIIPDMFNWAEKNLIN